MQHWRRGL